MWGPLKKKKGPSLSWEWRSQGPQTSKPSGNSGSMNILAATHGHCSMTTVQKTNEAKKATIAVCCLE